MVIPLKLSRQDYCSHRILRETTTVGWIGPDAIRLWGFADRERAVQGAAIAGVVRAGWGAGRASHAPPAVARAAGGPPPDVRTIAPGILSDGHPLDTHAIEIAVPRSAWLAMKLQLAQQAYTALLAEDALEDHAALVAAS